MCVRLPFRTNFNTTHIHTPQHTHTHTHARTYVCKLWEKHFFLLSCSLAWVFLIGNELIPFNELKNIVYLWVACAASASRESRIESGELLKLRFRFVFPYGTPVAHTLVLFFIFCAGLFFLICFSHSPLQFDKFSLLDS